MNQLMPFRYKTNLFWQCILILLISFLSNESFSQMNDFECGMEGFSSLRTTPKAKSRMHCHGQNVTRVVDINIHFLLRQDVNNPGNYTETQGLIPGSQNGFGMANEIVETANWLLGNNPQMFQPIGNTTNNNPVNIQWRLNGVYFDRDDIAFGARFGTWRNLLQPLLINEGSEVNVFFSTNNIGVSGEAFDIGLTNNSNYTIIGGFDGFEANNMPHIDPNIPFTYKAFFFADVMNHEIGHLLNLWHPFRRSSANDCSNQNPDFCDDTYTFCNGPGDTGNHCFDPLFPLQNPYPDFGTCQPEVYSNTFMDYNINHKSVSPCQIERMHEELCDSGANYHTECNSPAFMVFEENTTIPNGTTDIAGEIWAAGDVGGGTTNLHAGLQVKMSPGFSVARGATFNAGIRNCGGNGNLQQSSSSRFKDDYVATSLPPKKEILIYPNPTDNLINIQLNENHERVLTEVFDSFGRLISKRFTNGNELLTMELPSVGLYFVQVSDPVLKERLFFKKVVKN